MNQDEQIDIAFKKWWVAFNSDSDDPPGDRALAFAAFSAGYLRHLGESAPPVEVCASSKLVQVPRWQRPKTHKEISSLIAPQLIDALFQFEANLNSLPENEGWSFEVVESVLKNVAEPIEWMEALFLTGAVEVPESRREIGADVLDSKPVKQLAKVIDKSCASLMSLRTVVPNQDRVAICIKVLRDVRYAANDLRRALGEPIPDRRSADQSSLAAFR
jgi:hypothetical protein